MPPPFYRQIGKKGPPVILLHGFGNSGLLWMPFILPLRNRYRFFVLDLPGHGQAKDQPLTDDKLLPNYAASIQWILDHHALGQVRLVGFSLGAYACQHYLIHFGQDRIERYLNIDHPPWSQNEPTWRCGLNEEVLALAGQVYAQVNPNEAFVRSDFNTLPFGVQNAYVQFLKSLAERSFFDPLFGSLISRFHDAPILGKLMNEKVAWPWAYSVIKHYYLGTYDHRDQLHSIRIPVTLLVPRHPRLFQGDALPTFQKVLPQARGTYFEKGGHDLMYRQGLRFYSVFSEFLS